MAILQKSHFYLEKIKNKEESFTTILNRSLLNAKLSSSEVLLIRDILKATVNKYYFIRYEIKHIIKTLNLELTDNDLDVLILCAAMIQYVKHISREQVMNILKEDVEDLNLSLDLEKINEILNILSDKPIELSEKINSIVSKKVSLLYSYPEWIVKMMFKHFGVKETYKSIASSRRVHPIVVNYNPMKISPDDLDNSLFVKNHLVETSYSYIGKEKIIEQKYFKENKIFVEDETCQLLIDVLSPKQGDDILFVDNSNGVLALDACLRCNDFCSIKVACKDSIALHATRSIIHRFQVSSIECFETDAKLLITHVEPRKMDKVLVIPNSSGLGLIRKHPDILLSLKREELDGLISNQKNVLEESERFVKTNGVLVYAVYTMNLKEGQNIIKEFLENHKDYSLLEERQVFPFEGPSDGVYFAKLRKNG